VVKAIAILNGTEGGVKGFAVPNFQIGAEAPLSQSVKRSNANTM
jgi:hypothetical protein